MRETLLLPLPVAAQRLGLRRGCTGVDQRADARGGGVVPGRTTSSFFFERKIVLDLVGFVAWE